MLRAVLMIALLGSLFWSGCDLSSPDPPVVKDAFLLGTVVTIRAHGDQPDDELREILEDTMTLMDEVGSQLSVYEPTSEINAINREPDQTTTVSDDLRYCLEIGLRIAEKSEGAYDPTVGPLVDLWRFYDDEPESPPDYRDIQERLDQVDYRRVDLQNNTLQLEAEMALDIEAINKGYAADQARDYLRQQGVSGALVSAGVSSVAALGTAPEGRLWRVGLEHPRRGGEVYAAINLEDGECLSTSGDYQRYFEHEGTRYPHILDARTGWPGQSFQAVTVLADNSTFADALSTALFAMKPEAAFELVEQLEDVEAVFILATGERTLSSGMEERLEILE